MRAGAALAAEGPNCRMSPMRKFAHRQSPSLTYKNWRASLPFAVLRLTFTAIDGLGTGHILSVKEKPGPAGLKLIPSHPSLGNASNNEAPSISTTRTPRFI